ncbi:unnamed protein product [Bursaphelenchus xylophilus]|uniref:(pine wood nematode) hypothetical protein n=1 Tax=Bursaphelenchus xylophilus TaxID=6326 RepID=A0A1I7RX64_BURXY|nr:unnamed protein product [Bursaphelenchus xylophilus]CAG9121358.1 unnamed protein product [Bursaphelenchus xylophilus]
MTTNLIFVSCTVLQSLVLSILFCAKPKQLGSENERQRKRPIRRRNLDSPNSDEREIQLEYRGSEHTDDFGFPSALERSANRTPNNVPDLKTAEPGDPSTQEARSNTGTPTLTTGREGEDTHPQKKGWAWFKKSCHKKTTGKPGSKEDVHTGLELSGTDPHPGTKKKLQKTPRPLKEPGRSKEAIRNRLTLKTPTNTSGEKISKRKKSHDKSNDDTNSDCSSHHSSEHTQSHDLVDKRNG